MRVESAGRFACDGTVLALVLGALVLGAMVGAPVVAAAPAIAYQIPIQGLARGPDDALIATGHITVRIYADSTGGSPIYHSGAEFDGAIADGIFDLIVGQATPLTLDPEAGYFLELDVDGTELIGDAAGGRWKFRPGGGSRARPDLEARIAALEAALGLGSTARRAQIEDRSGEAITLTGSYSSQHALLGLGEFDGTAAGYSTQANLLVQPVGVRSSGGIQIALGPYYLFTPGPNPMIRFVRDVPGDQGRSVRIRWRRDLRERAYSPSDTLPQITGYTVYRRVEAGQSAAAAATPEAIVLPPGEWDVLATIPATLDTTYQTVVATLCDSTGTGTCFSTFMVRSLTDRVGTFYNSAVDSGYSVDNLAPAVPEGLTVEEAPGGGALLAWQASTAPDFQYFRVYRSTDPDFTPGPGTLVHSTTATTWTDPSTGAFTYKLTALDFNGNESPPASVTITTGVEAELPSALALASMSPNPFRRTLTFVIEVPEAGGHIDLSLFDLAGRRIRTLASGSLSAGRHTLIWDGRTQDGGRVPAGVYVARLTGAGRTITRRATLIQ